MSVVGRIAHAGSIQGADFDVPKGLVGPGALAKVCIPSPSMLQSRDGRAALDDAVYPEIDAFIDDLAAAYRAGFADLAARGCRYLQLNDTNLACLSDESIRQATAARGEDPNALPRVYCRLINETIRGRPDDMAARVHLCRGTFKSA